MLCKWSYVLSNQSASQSILLSTVGLSSWAIETVDGKYIHKSLQQKIKYDNDGIYYDDGEVKVKWKIVHVVLKCFFNGSNSVYKLSQSWLDDSALTFYEDAQFVNERLIQMCQSILLA